MPVLLWGTLMVDNRQEAEVTCLVSNKWVAKHSADVFSHRSEQNTGLKNPAF